MKILTKSIAALTLLCTFILASSGAWAASNDQKLFINLTSDETNRASMAIVFATRVLTEMNIPVTIHLTVEGTRIADKNIPAKINASGDSLKDLLARFMDQGGRVFVCSMCMMDVGGIKQSELIDGVQTEGAMPVLFEPGTTVVSY